MLIKVLPPATEGQVASVVLSATKEEMEMVHLALSVLDENLLDSTLGQLATPALKTEVGMVKRLFLDLSKLYRGPDQNTMNFNVN